ncbi:MAG: choice-of-anchor D domain-containing protein, partial [Bacteroidota bacterium]
NRIFFEASDTTTGKELYSALASTARISYALPDGTILGLGDTIDFGAVTPGFTAEDFLFIANTGTDTSLVTASTFATTREPFDIDASNFNRFLPPAPENWPSLPITYSPTTTGEFMDTVIITSASQINDFFFFFLRGTTVVPDMSVAANGADLATAETIDFGDVLTDRDSTTTLTISNNGDGLLVLNSATLTTGAPFSAGTLLDTLANGETVTLDVSFMPTETGDFSDELTLSSNMDADFIVNLTGTAIINSINEEGLPTRSIYPNPVGDQLTVELASPLREGQWRIFSAVGQEMSRGVWPAGQSVHYLSVGELPIGVYHLEVSSGADRVTAKLIKR